MKNQASGYQVRLPKIGNLNRQSQEYIMNQMRRQGQQLPPLVSGQAMGVGGSHLVSINNSNSIQQINRANKLKSINK